VGPSAVCAVRPLAPKITRASRRVGSWWRVSLRLRGRRVHGMDLATITLAFIAVGLTAAEPRDFRTADTQSKDHPTARALVHMSELVSDRTQGRHRMIIYPEGVLGEQEGSFEQTRTGGIDINRTNMAPLASFVGKANILGLPFLFRSADHLHKVLEGPIGDDVLQSLEPHGFVGLAFFESGARSVYTVRRPVRTIDDIKGLRIRLQQSDLMVEMFAALGAEPVILPYTRTKTALMTGLIDAAENNWPSYVATDHHSVAPYFALTPEVLIMSMTAWRSLSPADQNIFRNAARDSSIFLRGLWKNWEGSFRKQAQDLGVTVIEIDRKPLSRIEGPLYESSDGFAVKTACRVHPKRRIKFSPDLPGFAESCAVRVVSLVTVDAPLPTRQATPGCGDSRSGSRRSICGRRR
jgi:tripartite ATP-independent transporter DctP family solute receptor